jgi:ribosomal protein S27AE
MQKKICPQCSEVSYSASQLEWICPYCGADLSLAPAGDRLAEAKEGERDNKKKSLLYRMFYSIS